ncbi:MAG TPA: tetratricopeptide repeat protein, partial [Spirochaetia bacterium]|nr:tetratricopeptide repeat protein [Spirochaetia bacterium]
GPSTISLSQGGTYVLGRLLANSQQSKSAGVAQALSSRLTVLFGAPASQSATMGVRADKADDSGGISWTTSDAQVYVDSGKAYIKSGDYPKAIDELKQALDYATDSELPEVRYYLGYAYSLAGNTRDALKQIGALKPGDLENDAADLVILKGKLLFDTSAFAGDVQWLSSNASLVKNDTQRAPLFYLLLGLSYNGSGDRTNAKENLEKVVAISADSELGKTAAELLKQL